jgi:hypothetical protein
MQFDFVIFHLHCRTSGVKVPLLSNDLSEGTGLAICPVQGELLGSLNLWLRKTEPYPSNVFWLIKQEPNRLLAWLAGTPAKTRPVRECRFDWILGIF